MGDKKVMVKNLKGCMGNEHKRSTMSRVWLMEGEVEPSFSFHSPDLFCILSPKKLLHPSPPLFFL